MPPPGSHSADAAHQALILNAVKEGKAASQQSEMGGLVQLVFKAHQLEKEIEALAAMIAYPTVIQQMYNEAWYKLSKMTGQPCVDLRVDPGWWKAAGQKPPKPIWPKPREVGLSRALLSDIRAHASGPVLVPASKDFQARAVLAQPAEVRECCEVVFLFIHGMPAQAALDEHHSAQAAESSKQQQEQQQRCTRQ
jgi:roadblock/LC7 domain-containing protein